MMLIGTERRLARNLTLVRHGASHYKKGYHLKGLLPLLRKRMIPAQE